MKRLFALLIPLLSAVFIAGCMNTTGEVSKSATPSLTNAYYISSVDVAFADKARINKMLRLNNPDSQKVANQIKANVETTLRSDLNQSFKGKTPAKLQVRIRSADVSSGAGRVMGSASFMTSDVLLSDAKTKQTIKVGTIETQQVPFRGQGNIGLLVMVAANAGTTLEKRYQELSKKYASDVVIWAQ